MCDIERRFPEYTQQPHWQILNNTDNTLSVIYPTEEKSNMYTIERGEVHPNIISIVPYPKKANYPEGYIEEWIKCIDGVVEVIEGSAESKGWSKDYMLVVFDKDDYKVDRGIQLISKELIGDAASITNKESTVVTSLTPSQLIKQLVTELVRFAWLMKRLPTQQRKERLEQLVKAIKESTHESTH